MYGYKTINIMKHFTTMLLAVGLASFSAIGQNVSVIMKDGTVHKFNADYLSELSFKDVPVGPETVEFKSVSVEPYSNGNVTLTFKDESGNIELVTDLYGRKETTYLRPGVYTVSDTNEPYTVDPGYSSLTTDNNTKNITAGTVDISLEGKVFTFLFDLTIEDGSQFKGKYTGELDTYTQWVTKILNKAAYNENPQPAGDFYVKLSDESYSCEMAVVFTGDAADTELQPGVYTYSTMRAPGTISPASYVDLYNPNSNVKLESGSKVTVAKEGNNYTMTMDLLFNDGRTGNFSFTGEITGTPHFVDPTPQPDPIVFDIIDVNPYGNGNTGLTFNISTDKSMAINLDCYGSAGATYFETGEYVVGTSGPLRIDTDVNYTFVAEDGKTTAITSGKMDVSREGGVYTFDMDFTLADGQRIVATYTGKLNKFTPVAEYTVTKAAYNENARPAGNFYVKFNDDNWNCSVGLDFFADASAQLLPAGTYTYSTANTPGTISGKSYVETNSTYYAKEGSKVIVEVNGSVYTINMTIVKEDGTEAIVSFNGEITGTPVFE